MHIASHQKLRGWRRRVAAALLGLFIEVLVGRSASACTSSDGFALVASAEAEIAYRWEPPTLKVGQFFAAEVIACRAPGVVQEVILDAQMPAHGHGMNYRPTVQQTGPGRFLFSGLMLHMAGTWRLTFDLMQGDKRTRLSQDVMLTP